MRRHLQVEVAAYDASIRTFIPGYEEMLAQTASIVAEVRPIEVVDLGAGTGALSEAVLSRCNGCSVELIDVDGEMLDQARQRLHPFAGRTRFSQRPFQGALPRCDAVVASLALHHVPNIAEKQAVFAAIFDALRPGGVFVNADANMPADAAAQQADYRAWAAHMVRSGIPEARAWQHFAEWADEDTYLPLDDELAALAEVGFDATCVWRNAPMAVVRSVKLAAPETREAAPCPTPIPNT